MKNWRLYGKLRNFWIIFHWNIPLWVEIWIKKNVFFYANEISALKFNLFCNFEWDFWAALYFLIPHGTFWFETKSMTLFVLGKLLFKSWSLCWMTFHWNIFLNQNFDFGNDFMFFDRKWTRNIRGLFWAQFEISD